MQYLNSFPKKEKLCGEIRIGKLFAEGNAFLAHPLRIVYKLSEENTDSPLKILISVPKKKIKKAVNRNRIKRLIREAYRLNKTTFIEEVTKYLQFLQEYENRTQVLFIAITYISEKEANFSEIEKKIKFALSKILSNLKS
ncbi:MAG: ribonuclease P protein component [Paludibacter sp.]|nr:ribonuclease P protein component [Paludibacter sp.]